jgi:hypothetical protein
MSTITNIKIEAFIALSLMRKKMKKIKTVKSIMTSQKRLRAVWVAKTLSA